MKVFFIKRTTIYLVSALLIIAAFIAQPVISKSKPTDGTTNLVYDAFNDTAATLEEINLTGWTLVNNKYLTKKELLDLAVQAAAEAGIGNQMIAYQEKDNLQTAKLKLTSDSSTLSLSVQSVSPPNDLPQTYLLISISQKNKPANWQVWQDNLKSILSSYAKDSKAVSTALSLKGYLPGEYRQRNVLNKARAVVRSLDAQEVSLLKDQSTISLSAYSPLLEEKVTYDNEQINLDLYFRYNRLQEKTYFYLGTPLIFIEH